VASVHTMAYTLSGQDPDRLFPAVLGHEGARCGGPGAEGVNLPGRRVIT